MKKAALMQPYLFPYLGYFQMINAVDLFIVYDDVQWMKGGWINRNRILVEGKPEYVTLPVKKDSHKKLINERIFLDTFEADKQHMLTDIKEAYLYAPHFEPTIYLLERCFDYTNTNVAQFIVNTLRICCEHIGIKTKIVLSSNISGESIDLRAQERVINIISSVGATEYVNAIGGEKLYDREDFKKEGISIKFIRSNLKPYVQFKNNFVPGLSMIDVMMFNSTEQIKQMLGDYELV